MNSQMWSGTTRFGLGHALFLVFLVVLTISSIGMLPAIGSAQDAATGQSDDSEELRDQMEASIERLRSEVAGTIEVAGTVHDAESGRPMQAVHVVVKTSIFSNRFNSMTDEFGHTETIRETVSGQFQYSCESCTSLRLLFFADGYHSEKLIFYASDGRGRLEESSLRVELEPYANPIALTRYQGQLVLSSDSSLSKVLPILTERSMLHSVTFEGLGKLREKDSVESVAYVRLLTNMDKSGRPLAIQHPRINTAKAPEGAILDFSIAGGGAIFYEPKASSVLEIDREMRLAPASGYEAVLNLDAARDSNMYFYVRIGDRYGRGRVSPPYLAQHRGDVIVGVSLVIDLNPDGSRNLETID